jgi:hypothetical protein
MTCREMSDYEKETEKVMTILTDRGLREEENGVWPIL